MLRLLILIPFLIACGSKSGGSTAPAAPAAPTTGGSFYADTADDLPECTEATEGSLGYAEDDQLFYGCEDEEWAELEGRINNSVVATYLAEGDGRNLCTTFDPDDNCYFDNARLDVFANGDWFVRILFRHMYTEPSGDYQDTQDKDISFLVTAGDTNGATTLVDNYVFRTGDSGALLWATITKRKDLLVFVHDTDDDSRLEESDDAVGAHDWTLVE